MKLQYFFMMLLACAMLTANAQQQRKVLVIGIDGTRSDALQQANTPHIDSLATSGIYTYNAWHCGITISGPSWSDIMCGVWEGKHGVTNNTYSGSNFDQYPYFVKHAKEVKPDLYCVQVVEWPTMSNEVYNDGWDVKLIVPDGQGTPTADSASAYLADTALDCIFVYFDAVDLSGHSTGFSPSNSTYISAIEGVDGHIGTVLNALKARPTYAQEDWLVLVITDHGGTGTIHGGASDDERHIWWIATGDAVGQQALAGGDAGTYQVLYQLLGVDAIDENILATTPVQTDIAVTALHHLIYDTGQNPEDNQAWDLDGKSWIMDPTSVKEQPKEYNISLYPNPVNDLVTVWFENTKNAKLTYTLTNAEGKVVTAKEVVNGKNKLTLDMAGQAAGMYFINLTIDGKLHSKSFIKK